MQRIIFLMALLVVISMMFSCSKGAKNGSADNAASAETKSNTSSDQSSTANMADLPDVVFNDVKTKFINDGMTLVSLKRDMENKSTIIKAIIKETDPKTFVPKAMKIISENFSSVDKIVVIPGEKGTGYELPISKLDEVMKKYKSDGGDLNTMLWSEISGGGSKAQDELNPQVEKK